MIGALLAISTLSMAQSASLQHIKTGDTNAGSGTYRGWNLASGSSVMSSVSASATGGYSTGCSAGLTIKIVVRVTFAGSADLNPSATLGYSFGRSRSASAVAVDNKTGGSAKGTGTIDTLTKTASVGVGEDYPPAAIDSTTESGTATIASGDFTWDNGIWTGTYEVKIHNLSASGSLNHPVAGNKDDEGAGAASLATSNFIPSNVIIHMN